MTINFGEAFLKNKVKHSIASKEIKNTFNNHHSDDMLKLELAGKDVMITTYPNNAIAQLVDKGTEKFDKNISFRFNPKSSPKQATRNAINFFFQKMKIK